ncbi:hypothetical protein C2R22_15015 [Salinigranum rubrum]|uniref:UspA domain-containing protein n=1 Tax=Salinigranum rubrum TaxID=755307 RepID=A0A2I8VLH6_9EURY|nr:hypothetical protein [Salinigranum rubrum]AUV82787.1 hypothetical protein C2R22_15015 [Salinigranum rubrum]
MTFRRVSQNELGGRLTARAVGFTPTMTLLVVHPIGATAPPSLGPLSSSPVADERILVLSVMSERAFRKRQAVYASLPDLGMEYSRSQGEESAERHAQAYTDEVLRSLGPDVTVLGRVGDELRTVAAVARAYEADRIVFTTPESRLRRWYRRWRLGRLDFDGRVSHPPPRDAPGLATTPR